MSDMTVGGVDTVKLAKELHDLQKIVMDNSETITWLTDSMDENALLRKQVNELELQIAKLQENVVQIRNIPEQKDLPGLQLDTPPMYRKGK